MGKGGGKWWGKGKDVLRRKVEGGKRREKVKGKEKC
jgi:hypothetical protein